jgi:osmotically-inducible protein OsmY
VLQFRTRSATLSHGAWRATNQEHAMKTKILTATLASLIMGGLAVGSAAFAEETAGEKLDDATLVAKIKTDLLKSRAVDGLNVNVDAKNGVVTLSGQAGSDAERKKAEDIATHTKGVKSVDNKLVIKAN